MIDSSAAPPPGGESPGPGSRLQREREKRGMSLFEAAEKLRVDPQVIDALENNRFASIGPVVFAKGHLKQYAALLGLPAAEISSAYEALQVVKPVGNRAAAIPAVDDRAAAEGAADLTPFPKIAPLRQLPFLKKLLPHALPIGAALLALLVVSIVLLWWKPWQHRAAQVGVNSQGAEISAPITPESTDDSASSASTAGDTSSGAAMGNTPQTTSKPVSASSLTGRVRLRMSFSADSWVDVRDAGGVTVYRGKGAANSVKTVAGAAPLTVYLGYASGVQLELNNHAVAIGPQFMRGEVARFEVGADGVLRRSPRS